MTQAVSSPSHLASETEPTPQQQESPVTLLRDVRVPNGQRIVFIAGLLAFGALLWAARGVQFYQGEWQFVTSSPSAASVPSLIYRALLEGFSLRTHLPEEVVLLAEHVVATVLLFRVVRRRSGDLLALGAAGLLLVLGWGSASIVSCCAGQYVGSVVFGLIAFDLLDSRAGFSWRIPAAAVALVLSLGCSALGLAFVAAVAVQVLLEPDRLRRSLAPLIPAAASAAWFAVAGRYLPFGVNPLSGPGFALLAGFTGYGVASAGTAAAGFGSQLSGWPVLVSLVVIVGLAAFGSWRRLDSRVLSALAGLGVTFITAGLAQQATLERNEAGANRYVYVAVTLLVLLITAAVARLRWRPLVVFAVVAFSCIGIIGNAGAFRAWLTFYDNRTALENVALRTVNAIRLAPDLDRKAPVDRVYAPGIHVGSFFTAERTFGAPVPPGGSLAGLAAAHGLVVDDVLRQVLASGLRLTAGPGASSCKPTGTRSFQVASGTSRTLYVLGEGTMTLSLGWAADPMPAATYRVEAGLWTLHVPNVGVTGFKWRVVIASATAGLSAC